MYHILNWKEISKEEYLIYIKENILDFWSLEFRLGIKGYGDLEGL